MTDTNAGGASGLVQVDLVAPDELRNRWAATAAVLGAKGWGISDCNAVGGDWYYHDGGGNWCKLFRYADGRALLIGSDHEYSETYFREAAAYFEEEETDLLAGAPEWWADALRLHDKSDGEWVSFIYGWDGSRWLRADYDLDDGFETLALPAASLERVVDVAVTYAYDDDPPADADPGPAQRLVRAGPSATPELVAALGPGMTEPATGAAVAAQFAADGQH